MTAARGGRAGGDARLRPSDHSFGGDKVVCSCISRDAHPGPLPGMPQNLCHADPPD